MDASPSWWPPIYREVCGLLGIDPAADAAAANELAMELFPRAGPVAPGHVGREATWARLRGLLGGASVAVLGGAPRLVADLPRLPQSAVVVASGGALGLLRGRVVPELVVTDLDGDPGAHAEASRSGALTVVHAHADNHKERRGVLPLLWGPVAGSSQPGPHPELVFSGGFTDGDRAAALAAACGAREVLLLGFDPEPPPGHRDPARKRVKLEVARRVLVALGESRVRIVDPGGFLRG